MMSTKVIFASDVFHELTRRAVRWGIVLGFVCGIVAGLPIFVIGALCGLALGPFVGMICGALAGWILGAVTTSFYLPLPQAKYTQYRIVAALICVTVSLIFAYIVQGVIFHAYSDITSYLITFTFIPAILAAFWSSQSLATWYITYCQSK